MPRQIARFGNWCSWHAGRAQGPKYRGGAMRSAGPPSVFTAKRGTVGRDRRIPGGCSDVRTIAEIHRLIGFAVEGRRSERNRKPSSVRRRRHRFRPLASARKHPAPRTGRVAGHIDDPSQHLRRRCRTSADPTSGNVGADMKQAYHHPCRDVRRLPAAFHPPARPSFFVASNRVPGSASTCRC